ncbi:hypothetical protein LINPERPRIM_LOCUS37950 [Linum perenne]
MRLEISSEEDSEERKLAMETSFGRMEKEAFIEEFNYPMPRNCGGGKTGVFVNGRELHEQDLECLSKRGLPTLEHMFYILEIDGRLYDMTLGESFMGLANLLQRVFGPSVGRMPYGTSKFNQRATKTNSCLFQRTVFLSFFCLGYLD